MKKVIFGLIATFCLFFASYSQHKVNLVDIPNVEVAFLIDLKNDNTFNDYFLLQYSENNLSNLELSNDLILSDFNKDYIKIKDLNSKKIITFTIDKKYSNTNEVVIYGYGFSKKSNNFKLNLINEPNTILDIIQYSGKFLFEGNVGGLECNSGGVGSSECSTTGSDMGQIPGGGGGCSVKCSPGYYACCDGGANECRCKKNKK
jgi:hypothetical protein